MTGKLNMLLSHGAQSSIIDIICYQEFAQRDLTPFGSKMPQIRP